MTTSLKAAFKSGLTDLDTTAQEDLGAIRMDENNVYKYVKFSGSNAVAVGDLVGYVASGGATDTHITVDGAVGSGPAGVALAVVGTGTVLYGWIQIQGLAVSSAALAGSPTAGQTLKQGTYPAFTLQTAATIPNAGVAYDVTNKLVQLTLWH